MRIRISFATAVVTLTLCGISHQAIAQTAGGEIASRDATLTPPERLERARALLRERAETRPLLAPPPIGLAPTRVIEGQIDWALAGRLVAVTQRADAARTNATRAITAPTASSATAGVQPGLRAVEASRLPRLAPPEVARVSIPVLAPATTEIAQSLQVIGQESAYTAIATAADGVALRISGARKKLVLPEQASPRLKLRQMRAQQRTLSGIDAEFLISRSENSTDLSFAKFGAGYVLSVICDDPDDARCAEDDYIISLAERMALLNPERLGDAQ